MARLSVLHSDGRQQLSRPAVESFLPRPGDSSGGKDSCYNMMQCVAAGHTIVALANLRPAHTDELDSYMYQTVGHQAIELYAEAMDLPLYRRTIEGSSVDTSREYSPNDADEVEDLYQLLRLVKEKEGVEAVSVGAILSDYQRVRVENVCSRLQLQPLAYLWRREQADLLSEMISSGLQAFLIKVAAYGLNPGAHLEKTLAEMEPYLHQLSKKYGVHICGEGGEYETFTTDCPLFKKRIVIDAMETIIHSDDAFAPVAYLRFTQMHTEDKNAGSTENTLPLTSCPCRSAIDIMTKETLCADKAQDVQEEFASNACQCQFMSSARSSAGYQWLAGISGYSSEHTDIQSQTQHTFTVLKGKLQEKGWQLKHIVLVHLYVSDMDDFGKVNEVYCHFFSHRPPARVCVQARLPAGQLLQMDVLLHDWSTAPEEGCFQHRDTLHVQSISHWAPANIGPYSQAVQVEEAVFCAGQIALVPCTMQLLRAGPSSQAQLCYSHMEKVLRAMSLTLEHALQAHCYVTDLTHVPAVRKVWHDKIQNAQDQEVCCEVKEIQCPPLVVSVMPSLPRGAAVELHVIAVHDEPAERTYCQMTSAFPGGSVHWQVLQSSTRHYATLSLSASLHKSCTTPERMGTEGILGAVSSNFQQALQQMELTLSPLCTRVFYKDSNKLATELSAGLQRCLESRLGEKSPALVLVPVLELPAHTLLHLSCWLSE